MMSQKSGFTSIGLRNILHLLAQIPKVLYITLRGLDKLNFLYISGMLTFCWDMVATHDLIRRESRHPQTQMVWIILLNHWAELWGMQYSVYCSPVIFRMSSFQHIRITRRDEP